ncbi:histidine kinase [Halobiforma lacisalsi AJ5]|uniref:histidine kinase n=1 Tax=Natronobacterium lacisalsi AJ5 TaxID=358396 RepID=M0LE64_NATLA|nr:GAF domain-containing sensor histidine kinase [Halobiforma lacisalsi]APW96385.1 histidine kinase [Halobiforma lacisalsi AJ5]EMA31847.1 signal-transducing histidine kinase [Halobiforma lacisalsi AJ5]
MEGEIRLLVVGATVPLPTREALSARGIRPVDDAIVEGNLETAGNEETDCVLVDPTDDDAPGPARLADAFDDPAIVAVSDGSPSAADLETPVTAVVRESDLRNRGAVVANRIHTATAATDRTTGGSDERGEDCGPLKRAADALSAVQTIETDPDCDVTGTIERILETAADHLEYPIGYVTRIENGVQEIVAAVGNHRHIQAGATDPLGRTYCRRTIEADEPIVLENAPEQGWDGDPAVERFGLRCYVGARVAVDDEVYGTLCFADDRAREELAVEIQGSVVEALASRVGYELEREQYEAELAEQRDNLEILNEVVRHDIRNDLQLVQAYAKMLEEHVDAEGAEHLEIVRESAENAIDLTTTARDLAEVMLRTDDENERIPLATTLEQQLSEIRSTYPDAAVTLERSPPSVEVIGNDMLGAVFRNLLKNAVQHNDKEVPTVTVRAAVRDGDAEVRIADNGPGVPDSQKEEIFGKGEKGLESEGSGIGLYLVQQLVEECGGEVWVEDNDPEGAVFVVRLPVAA